MSEFVTTVRRNRVNLKRLGWVLATAASLSAGLAQAQSVVPQDAKPLCAVAPSVFKNWFGGTVTLNGAVSPANSIAFPHKNDCDFYQWSEQMFLWLTSPAPSSYGGGNTLVFNSPVFYNVSGAGPGPAPNRTYTQNQPNVPMPLLNIRSAQVGAHGLQILTDKKGHEFEVVPASQAEDGHSLVRNSAGKLVEIDHIEAQTGKKPTFFDANNKKIPLPSVPTLDTALAASVAPQLLKLDAKTAKNLAQAFQAKGKTIFIDSLGNTIEPTQGQAGNLSGVLLGQDKSLVYYATMVNDVYAYFQTGESNGSLPATAVFPTTQAQLDPVIAYAATKGVVFPDKIALAVEIKTSWINTKGLDALGLKASDYFTISTSVPVYDKTNPLLWTPKPNESEQVVLALVGMHVVGSANGHPEMIWATFEHASNTPNAAYSYTNTAGATINVPQSAGGAWLFAAPVVTTPYNIQKANFKAAPNIQAATNQIIEPSDTLRLKAWGSGSNAANAVLENTEVISANHSVLTQLVKGDGRANYIMTGATWTKNGQAVTDTNQVGANLLNNTTMETYDQGVDSQINGDNCFSCHGSAQTTPGPANTGVSHIYSALIPLYPKTTK